MKTLYTFSQYIFTQKERVFSNRVFFFFLLFSGVPVLSSSSEFSEIREFRDPFICVILECV